MKYIKYICLLLLWIFVWLIIARYSTDNFITRYVLNKNIQEHESTYYIEKYDRFEDIDWILQNQYYDFSGIDSTVMIEDAVKSYVDWIWDPYTVYMDADTNSGFMQDLEWESDFEWIWAVVSKKDYYILVEEVIKDAPAYKAGIKPLDRIVQINWEYVQDESLDDAVNRMKWEKWTTVNIKIERIDEDENSQILEFDVVRDEVLVPSLSTKIFNIWKQKIWYLEVSMVWEETENLFKKEIPNLINEKLDWMIIDLRWNWWWLMDIAVLLVSHFIPKWDLVVKSKYAWFADEVYTSKWYWEFEWMKLVVLVDWLTASAGEIMALALQEQVNATILWTKTFGKWTIQTLHQFPDWASLKYTIGKRFPPSGLSIDHTWITPDVIVEFDASGYVNNDIDNQLEEAKSLFK